MYFALFSGCVLDCGGIDVIAFMWYTWRSMENAIEILSILRKRYLTYVHESSIKKCFPEWDKVTPLMKKSKIFMHAITL